MSTFVKSVLFVVVVSFALVGCGNSNNVMDTLRNVAQENFLPDAGATLNVAGKPMTRPEALAFWASESAKLVVCENVATKNGVVYINVLENGSKFAFRLLSNDKPGCGMARPWSPVLKSLLDSGAYSTADPGQQVASK
jgi:hypothetical protein